MCHAADATRYHAAHVTRHVPCNTTSRDMHYLACSCAQLETFDWPHVNEGNAHVFVSESVEHVTRYTLHVTRCTLHVARYTLHITRHTSHVTTRVTCHTMHTRLTCPAPESKPSRDLREPG